MNTQDIETIAIGHYSGALAPAFNQHHIVAQLVELPRLFAEKKVDRLSNGPDYVVKLSLETPTGDLPITAKVFKRQSQLKDRFDRHNKSKAERSYRAAIYLQHHDIGTPAPIAWLDRWENGRLLESYYLCLFEPAICFRDALAEIYHQHRDNELLMDLLHVVAPAIRAMHDAGFMHGDMGNQNILLPKDSTGRWGQPQFIDLNRCAMENGALDNGRRAFDLSRIALPGAYLKIFKNIYCSHQDIPADLDKEELKYRRRFERHRRSRKLRHPLRYWKKRHEKPLHPTYPEPQNIWLWDKKSAQPMIVLGRKEKHRYRNWVYMVSMIWQSLVNAPGIFKRYRQLLKRSYAQPLSMTKRIGVALHPKADYLPQELKLLQALGNPPVLIRFCHHEQPQDWQAGIELVEQLHEQGIEVMVALLQDRRAVLQPELWQSFLEKIIGAIGDQAAHIEITHASNRVKWGIWSATEYRDLMAPAFALQKRYPHIKLTGPACIDFEYHPVIAALKAIPKGQKLDALSHLLYVDRRGAPEGKQGKFSTLEKCALLKTLAQWSDRCNDKVIISEVNWPVKYTGIWSPIGCPYTTPKWRREEPGETEDDYANYMLRFLVVSLCSGHVEQVFWWRLSAHGYGLVDDKDNFRPRPAFTALVFFLKLLGTADFVRKQEDSEELYCFEFQRQRQKIVMIWTTGAACAIPREYLGYSEALNREGHAEKELLVSGAPIYLLYKDS